MKLDTEFTKLPLAFDVERMRAEVEAVPESDWRPHPQGHPGNSALPLISPWGPKGRWFRSSRPDSASPLAERAFGVLHPYASHCAARGSGGAVPIASSLRERLR